MNHPTSILIVDDDVSTRKTLSLILRKKGYHVEVAESGQAALTMAEQRAFDMALLDIRLPDMEGVDLLAPLKEQHPDMVLVMATGYASAETAIRAVNEGAAGYVSKPLDMDTVLLKIEDLLEQQRLRRDNRRLYSLAQQELEERRRTEQILSERERELKTLMSNLPGMAYRCQNVPGWTMEFVSEGCLELTGYAPEDLVHDQKLAYQDLIWPDDRALVWNKVQSALDEDRPFEITYRIVNAGGSTRWVWERGRGIRDDQGAVLFLEGVVHDVTERRQAEEISQRLYETSRALASSRDEDETIRTILQAVYRTLGCEHVLLSAVDEGARTIGIRRGIWNGQFDLLPEWIELSQYSLDEPDILTDIVRSGRTEIIEAWDPRFNRTIWEKFGHERFLRIFAPVKIQERVIGVIEVGYDRQSKQSVSSSEISTLNAFMDQLAVALESTRLLVETQERATRLQALHEIDRAILDTQSPENVAQTALAHVRRLIPGVAGYVALCEKNVTELVIFAADSDRPGALEIGSRFATPPSLNIERLSQREPIGDPDLTLHSDLSPALTALRATGIRAYLAVPLHIQESLIGILVIASDQVQHYTGAHCEVLAEIANQIAKTMHNARLEAASRTERERLRTLINNLPEGILLLDPDHKRVLSNPIATEMLGWLGVTADAPLDRLGTHRLADLLSADLANPLTATIQEPAKSLEMAAYAIDSTPGGTRGTLVLMRDVTELRQAQDLARQRDRLAAVGRLAGGVAHDFNNILTAITGYTDLVHDSLRSDNPLDWPPATEVRADLEQIALAADRAATLTRQLLIFSRKEHVQPQILDLNTIVSNMGKMLTRLIGEDIQLVLSTSGEPEPIMADPGQIEQVVMNLVVNARDAMPHGKTLTIETGDVEWQAGHKLSHSRAQPGKYVRLTVQDQGIGMSQQVLNHLFEPFFTTKAPGEGTGLGLATVYGIVQQANGHIHVQSKPGEGTTFDIYVPRVDRKLPATAQRPLTEISLGGSETILLVEDEDNVRDLARRILERRGYAVLTARVPSEALLLSERYRGPIDLLLTDVVMPEMNGQELATRIAAQRQGIKILFMSGYTGGAIGGYGIHSAGGAQIAAENLLQKPFDAPVLAQRVRQILGAPVDKPAAQDSTTALATKKALRLPETAAEWPGSLNALRALHPGDQLCFIFRDQAEPQSVLTSFVQQGLSQRHKVLCLADQDTGQALLDWLEQTGLDVETVLATGQLSIGSGHVAGQEDASSPDELIAQIQAQAETALAAGYTALRIMVDMARIRQVLAQDRYLADFGARLNALVSGAPVIALYQYDRRQFDASALLDALRMHPVVLIGTDLYDNFYHTHSSPISSTDQAEETLERWLANLESRRHFEATIRQSAHKLRSFIEHSDDAIVLTDEQGQVVEWNQGAAHLFGIEHAQTEGRYLWDVMFQAAAEGLRTPDSYQALKKTLQDALKTGWSPLLNSLREVEIWRPDGTRRIAQALSFAIQTDQGFILASSSRDMTEQKRAQESLIKSEARYRSLIEHIPAIIYEMPFGESTPSFYAGPQIEHILGFEQKAWTQGSKLWLRQLYPDDRMRVLADLSKSYDSGEPFSAEYRLVSRDKRPIWFHDKAVVVRDDQGNPLFLHGMMLEINERKQAEENLQHYARHLTLLNKLGQQIAAELEIERLLSQAAYLVREGFGYHHVGIFMIDRTRNELTMRANAGSYTRLFPFGHRLKIGQGMVGWVGLHGERLLANNVHREPRYVNQYPDLITTQSELAVPIRAGGELVGVLDVQSPALNAFGQDDILVLETLADQVAVAIKNARLYAVLAEERAGLAERVEERTAELSLANAELARAARLKDEFLANMSHELRTPLNAILGLSEAVQEGVYGPLTERQKQSLHSIGEAGHHLLTLVNDILDIAKAEAGKLELQIETVFVQGLCQSSLNLVRQIAHQKGIRLTMAVDEQAVSLQGDPRRLKQVLVNLLSNAVKFTPQGGAVELQVSANAARDTIHMSVRDTGIGISSEDLGRLFQPFVQLDGGLSRQHAGTGLGLAMVRRLVELHGGGISVQSRPGEGSQFTVSLPWVVPDRPPESGASDAAEQHKVHTQPLDLAPLVLLAEDNPANVTAFQDYLRAKGYRVIVACNGFEALELARRDKPDLILMDIQMPEMDGLTAIRHLRESEAGSHVPIIAMTALAMPGDRERCLQTGADEYMSKPVGVRQLAQAIEALLQPRQDTR